MPPHCVPLAKPNSSVQYSSNAPMPVKLLKLLKVARSRFRPAFRVCEPNRLAK
jgi:hypothetical protein